MDNLDNLPLKEDTVSSSHEEEVMGKFFPQTGQRTPPRGPPQGSVIKNDPNPDLEPEGLNWKVIGYTTVLFLALANPWVDLLFCKIPYCGDNAPILLGIKTLIFAILYL